MNNKIIRIPKEDNYFYQNQGSSLVQGIQTDILPRNRGYYNLKPGRYTLTRAEAYIINLYLPFTIKLEELKRIQRKYVKKGTYKKRRKPRLINNDENGLTPTVMYLKKATRYHPYKATQDRQKIEARRLIDKAMTAILDSPFGKMFFSTLNVEKFLKKQHRDRSGELASYKRMHVPSLYLIDKKVKRFGYSSFYEFGIELRNFFDFFFRNYGKFPEIYIKAAKFLNYCDNILEEIELEIETTRKEKVKEKEKENKKEVKEIENDNKENKPERNKDIAPQCVPETSLSLTQELNTIQFNRYNRTFSDMNSIFVPKEKSVEQMKGITVEQKIFLMENIQKLSEEQTREILSILVADHPRPANQLEFDIDELTVEQQNRVFDYVKNCIDKLNMQNSLQSSLLFSPQVQPQKVEDSFQTKSLQNMTSYYPLYGKSSGFPSSQEEK